MALFTVFHFHCIQKQRLGDACCWCCCCCCCCCCFHIKSPNQVRGHRTRLYGHSGVEEYPMEKTKKTKSGTRIPVYVIAEAIHASTENINWWDRESACYVARARPVLVHTFQDSHLKPTTLHANQATLIKPKMCKSDGKKSIYVIVGRKKKNAYLYRGVSLMFCWYYYYVSFVRSLQKTSTITVQLSIPRNEARPSSPVICNASYRSNKYVCFI